MSKSNIEWTEETWNCISGCTRVSAGCDHCYAVAMTHRLEGMGQRAKYGGLTVLNPKGERHFNGVVRCHEEGLTIPLRRKKPTKYFVNSMADLFHKDVPAEFIARMFAVMGVASWHTFQILTKRPERAAELLNDAGFAGDVMERNGEFSDFADLQAQQFGYVDVLNRVTGDWRNQVHDELPLPNIHLGTSVENQEQADKRIPHLLRCPAAVRFLSCEPLLGPVDIRSGLVEQRVHPTGDWRENVRSQISWVIVGGESGPGARPCNVEWIRSIVAQCQAAGVPCFVKQLGAEPHIGPVECEHVIQGMGRGHFMCDCAMHPHGHWFGLWLKDKKGGDMAEWPADLRVRQMPEARR